MVDDGAGSRPRRLRPPRRARGRCRRPGRRTIAQSAGRQPRRARRRSRRAGGLVVEAIGAGRGGDERRRAASHAAARRPSARRPARRTALGLPGGARRHRGRAGARLAQPRHAVGRRSAADRGRRCGSTSATIRTPTSSTDQAPVRAADPTVVRLWPGPRVDVVRAAGVDALIGARLAWSAAT